MKSNTNRVAILVDASSMWYDVLVWARKNGLDGAKLDYSKLLNKIRGDRECVAAVAVISPARNRDLTTFANALMHIGYGVRWSNQEGIPDAIAQAAFSSGADVVCLVAAQGNYTHALHPDVWRDKRFELYNFSFDESSMVLPSKELLITAVRLDESVLMGHF